MAKSSLASASPARPAKARPSRTRFERGIVLAEDRFEEIVRVATWIRGVPSSSGEHGYSVNLKVSICGCPDNPPDGERRKHGTAARYKKARTAPCSGCGGRFRHRDVVELVEDNNDDLTYLHGDLLCRECADAADVLF